jgi:hypothetical protein
VINWLSYWHPVLEALYFISGIVLVFGVLIAVRQLWVTKDIASIGVRREAAKLATEQCRYLAEKVVPSFTQMRAHYQHQNLTCLQTKAQANLPYLVSMSPKGEFTGSNYDIARLQQEWPVIGDDVVTYLNTMEYFAMPFAAGVADEKIAYSVAVAPFIEGVNFCIVALHFLRTHNAGRFESTTRLFAVWNGRLLLAALPGIQQLAHGNEIKIIGDERTNRFREWYIRLWLRLKPKGYG